MRVLVINGPNLNLLGEREPGVYGRASLTEVEQRCTRLAGELGVEVAFVQSNHEGVLIDRIQQARVAHDALIINGGGFSHTSIALADALRAFEGRIVEVHVSNIYRREAFRHHSHLAPVAEAVICGCGIKGYELALRLLADEPGS